MEHNNIFDKNFAIFQAGYPQEAFKLQKIRKDNEGKKKQVEVITGYTGQPVYRFIKEDGRKLFINRIYGEEDAVDKLFEEYGTFGAHTPVCVIGSSQTTYIRKMLKATKEKCIIIVYEPSVEVFIQVLEHEDISDLISDSPVLYLIEGLADQIERINFSPLFHIEGLGALKVFEAPNYNIVFQEQLKQTYKILHDALEDTMVTWGTMKCFSKVRGKNITFNSKHIMDGYSISQLENVLKGEIPAIIISAGPSLNKNIDELHRAKGKAVLIAVDTAIKPLLNRGILPDFFCIVDGLKPTELMDHPDVSKIPLVTGLVVASGIMDLHQGMKFFYKCGESYAEHLYKHAIKEAGCKQNLTVKAIPTGGSVANTAFSLAHYMGASKIIFVGQDLALTGNKTHADGTFKEKMDKVDKETMDEAIEVEGIHGNTVHTRADFYRYLRWFEEYISKNKMKNVIDATQGGAKIHGTKIMSLSRAIDQYCTTEYDIGQFLEKLPKMMDYAAKRGVKEFYESMPKRMEKVYKKAKQGISAYRKFEKLIESEEARDEELLEVTKRIKKLNDYMNTDEDALFVQDNLDELNFTMKMSIFRTEEDEKDERLSIAHHGMVMNYGIALEALWWSKAFEVENRERPFHVSKEDIQGPIDRFIYELYEEQK